MIKQISFSSVAIVFLTMPSLEGAGIGLVDIFKNISYTQSSGAAPTSPTGFFADVELTSVNPGDFNNVSVTYPGPGSPLSLPQVSPTFFSSGPGFATQAAMNAAIPFGAYQYTATNTGVSMTATLNYTTDAFTSAVPALSSATFSALQGLNPSTALTVGFNSFTPNAAASEGFTFFSIFNSSGTVFTDGFLAPGRRVWCFLLVRWQPTLLIPSNSIFRIGLMERMRTASQRWLGRTCGQMAPSPLGRLWWRRRNQGRCCWWAVGCWHWE